MTVRQGHPVEVPIKGNPRSKSIVPLEVLLENGIVAALQSEQSTVTMWYEKHTLFGPHVQSKVLGYLHQSVKRGDAQACVLI